jgi:hypothetical protein
MMETAENKNFTKKNETNLMLHVRRYFNSKISHAVDCTNVHCQGVDRCRSRNTIFKKKGEDRVGVGGLAYIVLANLYE